MSDLHHPSSEAAAPQKGFSLFNAPPPPSHCTLPTPLPLSPPHIACSGGSAGSTQGESVPLTGKAIATYHDDSNKNNEEEGEEWGEGRPSVSIRRPEAYARLERAVEGSFGLSLYSSASQCAPPVLLQLRPLDGQLAAPRPALSAPADHPSLSLGVSGFEGTSVRVTGSGALLGQSNRSSSSSSSPDRIAQADEGQSRGERVVVVPESPVVEEVPALQGFPPMATSDTASRTPPAAEPYAWTPSTSLQGHVGPSEAGPVPRFTSSPVVQVLAPASSCSRTHSRSTVRELRNSAALSAIDEMLSSLGTSMCSL